MIIWTKLVGIFSPQPVPLFIGGVLLGVLILGYWLFNRMTFLRIDETSRATPARHVFPVLSVVEGFASPGGFLFEISDFSPVG